jgi:NhaP-type Na+/H+ or K+/H+ antiporter
MIDVATSLALTGIYLAFATPTFLKPTDPMLLEFIVGVTMGAYAGVVLGLLRALSSSSHHAAGN